MPPVNIAERHEAKSFSGKISSYRFREAYAPVCQVEGAAKVKAGGVGKVYIRIFIRNEIFTTEYTKLTERC